MRQLPRRASQTKRGRSPWVAWVATVIVAVVLLVIIVIAATAEGIRIRAKMWELAVQRTSIPARETVYPESIPALPTVVAAPGVSEEISVLEAPTAFLTTGIVLRSGPGTEYAATAHLVAGEQVQILAPYIEIRGEWWQRVRTAEGEVGWCRASKLTPASVE